MTFLFTNNASTTLSLPITNSDTTLLVQAGDGAKFPNPKPGEKAQLVIADIDGNYEIVQLVSRNQDILVVLRGQEGTTPRPFDAGSRVELRPTAAIMDAFLQKTGGVMAGPLDMANHPLLRPDLSGEDITVASLRTALLMPPDGDMVGAITLRSGQLPLVGGLAIVPISWLDGIIVATTEQPSQIQPPWFVCDGTNGTPDLRDKFIVGAGTQYPLGTSGGSRVQQTTPAGGHDHGGTTEPHQLTIDEMPLHGHPTYMSATHETTTRTYGYGGIPLTPSWSGVYPAYTGTPDSTIGHQVGGTGGDQPHSHGITAEPDHTHDVTVEPPYYALVYKQFKASAVT